MKKNSAPFYGPFFFNLLKKYFSLFLLTLLVTGCGYRFGTGESSFANRSIYVPYVEGDESGFLTNSLIYALSTRVRLCSEEESPDLILQVCLKPPVDVTIGFRYANGKERQVISSDEARLTVIAEVKLIDCATGCLLGKCHKVIASIDYDFESDFSNLGEDTFSLGQLKMYNEAHQTSQRSLFKILSEKIVDSLFYCWYSSLN